MLKDMLSVKKKNKKGKKNRDKKNQKNKNNKKKNIISGRICLQLKKLDNKK